MDDAGAFFDPFAEVYDARLAKAAGEGPDPEVEFYRDLAHEQDGPALELGVGTGRVYLELLADGLGVDGIDLSEQSLETLRAKAADRGLEPSVWLADAAAVEPDRSYGLVYAPARVFNHLHTLADQRRTLARVRDILRSDGRVALNTFVPRFDVVQSYGEPNEHTVTVDGTDYRVVVTARLADEVDQVARIRREVHREGELVAERETPLALIPKRQFELLFECAGFSDWTVYGGFDFDPLKRAEQEMVWVAER